MAPVQPEASVVQVGLGIKYVGEYAYAYSGLVVSSGSGGGSGILLNFTSGSGLIVAKLQVNYGENQTDDMTYAVSLNGTTVQQWQCTGTREPQQPQNPLILLIPPFTTVLVTAAAAGGASAQDQAVTIVGRVYGVE